MCQGYGKQRQTEGLLKMTDGHENQVQGMSPNWVLLLQDIIRKETAW